MKSTTLIVNFIIIPIYLWIVLTSDNLTDGLSALASLLQGTLGVVNLNLTPTSLSDFNQNSLKRLSKGNRYTNLIFKANMADCHA